MRSMSVFRLLAVAALGVLAVTVTAPARANPQECQALGEKFAEQKPKLIELELNVFLFSAARSILQLKLC